MSIQTKLYVDDKVYGVLESTLSYNQPTDSNGRPHPNVFGGLFNIVIESTRDDLFTAWATHPTMMKHVKIVQTPIAMDGKSKTFELIDTHCIFDKNHFNGSNKEPMKNYITLSPAILRLDGKLIHEKHWKVTDLNAENIPITIRKTEEGENNISVKASLQEGTFVPMSIKDFNGELEKGNIVFNIEVKENTAERMLIEVRKSGSTVYREEINQGDILSIGKHQWKWDGFDDTENLNTYSLKNEPLSLKVTVWFEDKEEFSLLFIDNIKEEKYDWVDVDIQRNIKQIIIYLKVNLRDGGEQGIDKNKNIPKKVIDVLGFEPISKRTKSFKELENMALSGINKYWSRKRDEVETLIDGENWEITVIAKSDKKGMVAPKIIYFTNSKETNFTRSHNWELSRKLFYKIGYLKYDDWTFQKSNYADEDFIETSAHEIGHEILLAYGGQVYSKQHEGTSDILQNITNENSYPKEGEIDLMKYYKGYLPNDFYKRRIANSKDVLGLIWLSKLKIK